MTNILVTGATGQIGSELTIALRQHYGAHRVVAAGHRRPPDRELAASGPYCSLNVRDAEALHQVVHDYHIETIYHLASVLSAVAEQTPQLAWHVNFDLATMTQDMCKKLAAKFATERDAHYDTA